MRFGATRVEPSWLLQSDCLLEGMDRVLDDPIPRYAPNRDQVVLGGASIWTAPLELPLKALDVTEPRKLSVRLNWTHCSLGTPSSVLQK